MAIHNGLHSHKVRKSIGGLTYATWKGIPVVKTKATEIANPKTPAQRIQRAKMKALAQLGSSGIVAIRKGLTRLAQKRSEYNAFTSINMANVSATPEGEVTINFAELKFSQGERPGFSNLTVPVLDENGITVDFDAPDPAFIDHQDLGTALVINTQKSLVLSIEDDFVKSSGTVTIPIPSYNSGDSFHVYLFGRDPQTGAVSNTVYAGEIVAS